MSLVLQLGTTIFQFKQIKLKKKEPIKHEKINAKLRQLYRKGVIINFDNPSSKKKWAMQYSCIDI